MAISNSYQVYNGADLFVFVGASGTAASAALPLAHATSHTLTLSASTWDTSDKDTSTYNTKSLGRFDVSASCEGLVAYGSFEDILTRMEARAKVLLVFSTKASGADTPEVSASGSYASGEFYITGWDMTAPDAGSSTYSVSFEHCSGFAFIPGTSDI